MPSKRDVTALSPGRNAGPIVCRVALFSSSFFFERRPLKLTIATAVRLSKDLDDNGSGHLHKRALGAHGLKTFRVSEHYTAKKSLQKVLLVLIRIE